MPIHRTIHGHGGHHDTIAERDTFQAERAEQIRHGSALRFQTFRAEQATTQHVRLMPHCTL
jgi:hypothetical protein